MKKPIDTALSNKIKQTLENYQPEYKPAYWEEFERRRTQNTKAIFLFWPFMAKAAVFVLLFSGIPARMNHGVYPEKPSVPKEQIVLWDETKILPQNESEMTKANQTDQKAIFEELVERENYSTIQLASKSIRIENLKPEVLKFTSKRLDEKNLLDETFMDFALVPDVEPSENKMLLSFDVSSAGGSMQQTNAAMMESTIAASVPVGRKWLVTSGLRWQKNSENTNVEMNLSPSSDMAMKIKEHSNYQSISLPLSFQFKLKKNVLIGMGSSVDYVNQVNLNKSATLPAFNQVNQLNGESSLKQSHLVSNNYETTMEINHVQFFNHLRFGLSYQWQNSKRAMQFEPFMQLPLSNALYLNKIPMIGLNIKYQWKIG